MNAIFTNDEKTILTNAGFMTGVMFATKLVNNELVTINKTKTRGYGLKIGNKKVKYSKSLLTYMAN